MTDHKNQAENSHKKTEKNHVTRMLTRALNRSLIPSDLWEKVRERKEYIIQNSGAKRFRIELSGPFKTTKIVIEWEAEPNATGHEPESLS